jgi:hypothetical protein
MLAPFMPAEIAASKVVSDSSTNMATHAAAAAMRRRSFEFSPAQLSAFALKGMHYVLLLGAVLPR